ncbi:beta-CASP ribonuclease aCPSF1 [Candidatus Bathyarchaeota archaeon]|nr:MAG: beta-CASP ribonuclease aCPSF1 [Candidatus Bathyarchaeota archaeon]
MRRQFHDPLTKIREIILAKIPKEVGVTRINFEGSRLAIYVKKPEILLTEKSYIISDIVETMRRRIVVRSDPSVRVPEEQVKSIVSQVVPKEAGVENIVFNNVLGEVVIEARKTGLAIGKDGSVLQEVLRRTRWIPRVVRVPAIPSKIIANVRHVLYSEPKERERILRAEGERIFRPITFSSEEVLLIPLGGFREVGRSALLIKTKESSILVDCGINPGASRPNQMFPYLDFEGLDLDTLDAVVVTHSHLDHCGAVPLLYKYGYKGLVYCSEPTLSLMTLTQLDYLDVAARGGVIPPYTQRDVREMILHTVTLRYGYVVDIAPEVKLTLWNAGHILGSSIVHIHIGEGHHNIVITGDFKNGRTMLLDPSVTVFPRVETLVIESTYGGEKDTMPPRPEVEAMFISTINKTVERGGKVLIPTPAVGRGQEIMMVIDSYMRRGLLKEVPVYLDGMLNEATAIHTAYPEYLSRELRDRILREDINVFQSEYFTPVTSQDQREEIAEDGPAIVLATSGMMEGGPVLEYFKLMAGDPKNTLIFVSYQIEGTLGRRIKNGLKEVPLPTRDGKISVTEVKMKVTSIEGFSGHSDRRQLLSYVRRITPRPKMVVVCHGEAQKTTQLSSAISRIYRIPATAPQNLESVRVR